MKIRQKYDIQITNNDSSSSFMEKEIGRPVSSLSGSSGTMFDFLDRAEIVKINVYFDFEFEDFNKFFRENNSKEIYGMLEKRTKDKYKNAKSFTDEAIRSFFPLRANLLDCYSRISIIINSEKESDYIEIRVDRVNVFNRWEFRDLFEENKSIEEISAFFNSKMKAEVQNYFSKQHEDGALKLLISHIGEKMGQENITEEIRISWDKKELKVRGYTVL